MRELRTGLWRWQAPHPAWGPSEPWDQNVSSYAIVDDERVLLFDPLGVPSEIEALAAERETAIGLTAPWHERDAEHLVERLGVPVYTPLPDSARDLPTGPPSSARSPRAAVRTRATKAPRRGAAALRRRQ